MLSLNAPADQGCLAKHTSVLAILSDSSVLAKGDRLCTKLEVSWQGLQSCDAKLIEHACYRFKIVMFNCKGVAG